MVTIIGRIFLRHVSVIERLPCAKGKRSAVAVVNACPVDRQSRDRARRSELSAKLTEGLCRRGCSIRKTEAKKKRFAPATPPSRLRRATLAHRCGNTISVFHQKTKIVPLPRNKLALSAAGSASLVSPDKGRLFFTLHSKKRHGFGRRSVRKDLVLPRSFSPHLAFRP